MRCARRWGGTILVYPAPTAVKICHLRANLVSHAALAGSDVRSNSTFATPVSAAAAGKGDEFTLRGHKWFTSAPMSDGFLTLAQTTDGVTDGVSCFLVPRWLPDGSRNAGFNVQRLKDKIGDR